MKSHTYDIVIATRNRTDALALSIPLLTGQSRRPEHVIVVDSSDDPDPVREIVDRNQVCCDIPFTLVRSTPGLPYQRNVGLHRVKADVVFFPDDDSLVLPGALEAIMRVYDRDTDEVVGGVCSAEAMTAPANVLEAAQSTYRMSAYERLRQKIATHRYALERQFVSDPFLTHGRSRWDEKRAPTWLGEENAILVEYMTGFRMSFRTEVIRKTGFHEALGRYALIEDVDASFQVLRSHLLVGARNALIYHYRAPGVRASGRGLGIMSILNRAYVLLRHAPSSSLAVRQLQRYCLYKVVQYAAAASSRFGRERFLGALAAYRRLPVLLSADPSTLEATYREVRAACMAEDTTP